MPASTDGSSGALLRRLLPEIDKQSQLRGDADVHDAVGLGVYLADGDLPAHARTADPVRKSPRIRRVHCRVHQVRLEMRLARLGRIGVTHELEDVKNGGATVVRI